MVKFVIIINAFFAIFLFDKIIGIFTIQCCNDGVYAKSICLQPKQDTIVYISKDSVSYDSINDGNAVMFMYESLPFFKGNLSKFIRKHLKYPPAALRDSLEGQVYVEFVVDTNGNTLSHQVIRGVRQDLNEEALRITRLIKFDRPAIRRGKPVKMEYCLPIIFELSIKEKMRNNKNK